MSGPIKFMYEALYQTAPKPDGSEADHVEPNQGLHHQIT